MDKIIKHTKTGAFFIEGRGFTAKTLAKASRYPSYDKADEALEAYGEGGSKQYAIMEQAVIESVPEYVDPNVVQNTDGSSYKVVYRKGDAKKKDPKPSARRFRTRQEAVHHASRFMLIENHLGFDVMKTTEKVNAYINKKNGKTNPEIGKRRVNREVPVV